MGVETALIIGATGVGGGLSFMQARQQERASKAAEDNQKRAAAIERQQVTAQARQQALETSRSARRARGRILAAAAARGVSLDSASSLLTEVDLNEQQAGGVIDTNTNNIIQRIETESQSRIGSLRASRPVAGINAIVGSLSGLQTGLQISTGLEGFQAEQEMRRAQGRFLDQRDPNFVGPIL